MPATDKRRRPRDDEAQYVTVRIPVTPEQIRQCKALVERMNAEDVECGISPTFSGWKSYVQTCASIGFERRLAERAAKSKREPVTAEKGE